MITCEQIAKELAADPDRLKKRLLAARDILIDELWKRFCPGQWDLEHHRLISNDGTLALVWQTRHFPHQPAGPENPQYESGLVQLVRLSGRLDHFIYDGCKR